MYLCNTLLSHSVWKSLKKSHLIYIASEASNIYILSGQKFIKNTKNGHFGEFWQTEATNLTELPDATLLI